MTVSNDLRPTTMHKPHRNSPSTYLTTALTAGGTQIKVANSNIFKSGGEEVTRLTLGFDTATTETVTVVSYAGDDSTINVIRETGYTKAWPVNTKIARVFTSTDLLEIQNYLEWAHLNVNALDRNFGSMHTEFDELRDAYAPFFDLITLNKQKFYRGKYLGTSITNAQRSAINGGSFTDLYLGDYWSLGGIIYRIADFNYWTYGNNVANHVVIIPDSSLVFEQRMVLDPYDENLGGVLYFDTNAYLLMPGIKNTLEYIFGNGSLRCYNENLPRTYAPDERNIVSCEVELMTERQVFGQPVVSIDKHMTYNPRQFALFNIRPEFIKATDGGYWLRDLTEINGRQDNYCCVNVNGGADYNDGWANIRVAFGFTGHAVI